MTYETFLFATLSLKWEAVWWCSYVVTNCFMQACKLDNLLDNAPTRTVRTYDATVTAMTCHENIIIVGLSTKRVHIITSY